MIGLRTGHSMNPHSTKNTQDSHSTARFSLLLITRLSSVPRSITSKGLLQDTTLIKLHINNNQRHNNNHFIQKRGWRIPLVLAKWTMITSGHRWARQVWTSTNITRINLTILSMITWCSRQQTTTTYSSATIGMKGETLVDKILDQG